MRPDVPAKQPQGCTHFRVRQLMRRVSRHYDARLAETGLKTTQYSLLAQVCELGPVGLGELARAMRMDASTLSRNLKPMVAAGWLRVDAGDDERSRRVSITETGRAKRGDAGRHWRAAQDEFVRKLGVERVAALHALIEDSLALLTESKPQVETDSGPEKGSRVETRSAPEPGSAAGTDSGSETGSGATR